MDPPHKIEWSRNVIRLVFRDSVWPWRIFSLFNFLAEALDFFNCKKKMAGVFQTKDPFAEILGDVFPPAASAAGDVAAPAAVPKTVRKVIKFALMVSYQIDEEMGEIVLWLLMQDFNALNLPVPGTQNWELDGAVKFLEVGWSTARNNNVVKVKSRAYVF